jgi:hypothetical protein
MKFNFDKIVKDTKKILVGGAVTTASLLPLEKTNAQQNLETDNQNKTEINHNFHLNSYKKDYMNYMKDPSYKQRLVKEMFGDSNMQSKVDLEYERRLNSVNDIKIIPIKNKEESQFSKKDNTIYSSDDQMTFYHETSHGVDKPTVGYGLIADEEENYNDDNGIKFVSLLKDIQKDSIRIKQSQDQINNIKEKADKLGNEYADEIFKIINQNNYSKYFVDEFYFEGKSFDEIKEIQKDNPRFFLGISIDNMPIQIKNKYNKKLDILVKEEKFSTDFGINKNYYMAPSEIRARINSLRVKAFKDYKYNPSENFNINDYPKLKKEDGYLELIKNSRLTDEEINELYKYIAVNNEKIEDDKNYVHPEWNYDKNDNKA